MNIESKKYSTFEIWFLACRPKTLLASFVPVIVGSSLAVAEKNFSPLLSLVALIVALLIQVGTNFVNDLYDHLKGADNKNRVGPLRVLNSGLVSAKEMKRAIILIFVVAFSLGLVLVANSGLIILAIGILSIIAGIAYTAGPYPIAYNGLGDICSFIFFGLVGTVGTYYLNTNQISSIAFIAAIPVGALITNILVVNNYRDFEQDKVAGKKTLAVMLGKTFSLYEYIFLIAFSFLVPLIIYIHYNVSAWIFLPYVTFPFAYKLIIAMLQNNGAELNPTLELTAKLSVLFGFLFSLGFIL